MTASTTKMANTTDDKNDDTDDDYDDWKIFRQRNTVESNDIYQQLSIRKEIQTRRAYENVLFLNETIDNWKHDSDGKFPESCVNGFDL